MIFHTTQLFNAMINHLYSDASHKYAGVVAATRGSHRISVGEPLGCRKCCFLPLEFVPLAYEFHSPALKLVGTQISFVVGAFGFEASARPWFWSTSASMSVSENPDSRVALSMSAILHASEYEPEPIDTTSSISWDCTQCAISIISA